MATAATPSESGATTQCPLCSGMYVLPRVLPCQHSYCKGCLQSYVDSEVEEAGPGSTFDCAVCGAQTAIPEKGVSGFPDDFHLMSIMLGEEGTTEGTTEGNTEGRSVHAKTPKKGCKATGSKQYQLPQQEVGTKCDDTHSSQQRNNPSASKHSKTTPRKMKDKKSHSASKDNTERNVQEEEFPIQFTETEPCKIHPDRNYIMFCGDCQVLICGKCMSGPHKRHLLVEPEEEAKRIRQHSTDVVQHLQSILKGRKGHEQQMENEANEVRQGMRQNYDEVVSKVHARGQLLEERLRGATEILTQQIQKECDEKVAKIEEKQRARQAYKARIVQVLADIRDVKAEKNVETVVNRCAILKAELAELANSDPPDVSLDGIELEYDQAALDARIRNTLLGALRMPQEEDTTTSSPSTSAHSANH